VGTLNARLTALDQRMLDHITAVESPILDQILPRLSVAANYGRLWLGVAGVLAMVGSANGRSAAIHGLGSLALASVTANVLIKAASGRVRPTTDRLPQARVLRRQPVTTSFPSGHSASAAAFATGAALELPALAVPLGCLAGAVMVSRVVTGAHYPSDVIAGGALGIGAAALLRRWRRSSA
jgi:undecaprenyl-diphosphatase